MLPHAGTRGRRGESRLRSTRPYLNELDALRGLAIVAVVAIHVTVPFMGRAGLGGGDHLWAVLVNQVGRFSVPAFLFISGLLATYRRVSGPAGTRSCLSGLRAWGAVLWRRTAGILIPYLIWLAAGLFVTGWAQLAPGRIVPALNDLVPVLLLGRSTYYQLYFVPLIFQMYLLVPVLNALLGAEGGSWRPWAVLAGAVACQLVTVGAFELVLDGWLTLPAGWEGGAREAVRTTFPAWMGYFVAGMVAGRAYDSFSAWLDGLSIRALLATWGVSLLLLLFDYTSSIGGSSAPAAGSADFQRLAVVPYALISVLLLLRWSRTRYRALPADAAPSVPRTRLVRLLEAALPVLGQYSFGIYLVHVAVLRSLRELTHGVLQHSWYGATLLGLLVVSLSLVLAVLIGRARLGWVLIGHPTRRPRVSQVVPGSSSGRASVRSPRRCAPAQAYPAGRGWGAGT